MVEPSSSRRHTVTAVMLGALAALTLGCVGPGVGVFTEQFPEDGAAGYGQGGEKFKPVSAVLERRCGNLDCHGSPFRALRIYGKFGLRRPESGPTPYLTSEDLKGYFSGGIPTTIAEIADNYDAVVSLEPILTVEVAAGVLRNNAADPCPWYPEKGDTPDKMTPECLTLVRKPLLLEKHKGGTIWEENSPANRCLQGWLVGPTRDPSKDVGSTYDQQCLAELATAN